MRTLVALLALLLAIAPASPHLTAQTAKPRLIVLLMVDQMRADYADKYRHQWNHGLARLFSEGAWFRQANYPYASTVTCAGHSSVSTGTLPSVHGMVLNMWWDRDFGRVTACADDPSSLTLSYGAAISARGQSAARMLAPTLADELRAQLSPAARVAAFSLKARSAVTLGGQRPDAIAWASDAGAWVTSTAYPGGLVPAIASYVGAHPVEHQLWSVWDRALPETTYLYEPKAIGRRETDSPTFPHPLTTWKDWETSPASDEYLGRMALDVVTSMQFGQPGHTDFLAISFSALDLVGHTFGPNSHEVQDVLVRLDRTIGELLAGLDARFGSGNYLVALTSDHGVGPTPERAQMFGLDAGRVPPRAIPDAAQAAISGALGPGRWVGRLLNGDLYLETGVLERLRSKPGGVDRLREALLAVPGVDRLYLRDELANADSQDATLRRLAASYVADRNGDVLIVYKPYWLLGGADAASHGTLYGYDTSVPLVLWGSHVLGGEYLQAVTPLDVAPTLAYFAGITLPRAEGRVLTEALSPLPHTGVPRLTTKQR